jgi:hypothetical protein
MANATLRYQEFRSSGVRRKKEEGRRKKESGNNSDFLPLQKSLTI